MAFEQATIKVERQQEFSQLKSAIEQAFSADRVTKFLKKLDSRGIRVRDLDAVLAASALESATDGKAGTSQALYNAMTVSDQAQIREFYLSRIEDVEPGLRAKFNRLYQYY